MLSMQESLIEQTEMLSRWMLARRKCTMLESHLKSLMKELRRHMVGAMHQVILCGMSKWIRLGRQDGSLMDTEQMIQLDQLMLELYPGKV